MGTVIGRMPRNCPTCKQPFNEYPEEGSIIDTLYNIFFNKKEKGFIECDTHGWVAGDALKPVSEQW